MIILFLAPGCSQIGFSSGKDMTSIFRAKPSKTIVHKEFGVPYNSVKYSPPLTLSSVINPILGEDSSFLRSNPDILVSEREDFRYQGSILDAAVPFAYGFASVFTLGLAEFYLFPKSICYVLTNRKNVTSFSVWYSLEDQFLAFRYGDYSTVGTNELSKCPQVDDAN